MPTQFSLRFMLLTQLAVAAVLALATWLGAIAVQVVLLALGGLAIRHYLSMKFSQLDPHWHDFSPLIPSIRMPNGFECRLSAATLRCFISGWLLRRIGVAWVWAIYTAFMLGLWAWRSDAFNGDPNEWIARDICIQWVARPAWVFFALVIARHHYSVIRRIRSRFRAGWITLGRTLAECFWLHVYIAVGCLSIHWP